MASTSESPNSIFALEINFTSSIRSNNATPANSPRPEHKLHVVVLPGHHGPRRRLYQLPGCIAAVISVTSHLASGVPCGGTAVVFRPPTSWNSRVKGEYFSRTSIFIRAAVAAA